MPKHWRLFFSMLFFTSPLFASNFPIEKIQTLIERLDGQTQDFLAKHAHVVELEECERLIAPETGRETREDIQGYISDVFMPAHQELRQALMDLLTELPTSQTEKYLIIDVFKQWTEDVSEWLDSFLRLLRLNAHVDFLLNHFAQFQRRKEALSEKLTHEENPDAIDALDVALAQEAYDANSVAFRDNMKRVAHEREKELSGLESLARKLEKDYEKLKESLTLLKHGIIIQETLSNTFGVEKHEAFESHFKDFEGLALLSRSVAAHLVNELDSFSLEVEPDTVRWTISKVMDDRFGNLPGVDISIVEQEIDRFIEGQPRLDLPSLATFVYDALSKAMQK